MKWQYTASCMLAILVTVFAGCDNPETPPASRGRFVYYAISGDKPGSEMGLYSFNLEGGSWTQHYAKPIESCTQVAENGILLFEIQSTEQRLYGKCEDGNIIPVPFPVAADPAYVYVYAMPPLVQLSAQGHHAAYPVERVLAGVQNPARRDAAIVFFNCAKWKMDLIPVDSIVSASMAHLQVSQARVTGSNILISPGGETVWFTAAGLSGSSQLKTEGYAMYQWRASGAVMLLGVSQTPIFLEGLNARTNTLIYRSNDQHRSYNVNTKSDVEFPYTGTEAIDPQHVCTNIDAVVLWDDNGVIAKKASDGKDIYRIVDAADVSRRFGVEYIHNISNSLSISHDGLWVAFTLYRNDEPDVCDVFAVRSNGSELIRVAERRQPGVVSVGW